MSAPAQARRRPLDARLRASLVAVGLSGALLGVGGLLSRGPFAALSVGTGAAIAAFNLWALARIVTALLPTDSKPAAHLPASAASWALLAVLKMGGLFLVVWLLLRYALVSPLPMLIGFGALPIGIAIGSLVSDRSEDAGPP